MSRKRLILIIVAVLIIIAGIAITVPYLIQKNSQPVEPAVAPTRTNQELIDAIVSSKPSFKNDKGVVTVAIIGQPERLNNNWYIVHLQYVLYPDADPTTVLLYDEGAAASAVKVVLGPGTDFPDDAFVTITPAVPDIVKSEMNR